MKNIAYYNGRISSIEEMTLPMNDRAVYFGDGVYDVAYVYRGKCFALDDHIDRFFNSCRYVRIEPDFDKPQLEAIIDRLIAQLDPGLEHVLLYFQASRGTAPRSHGFPASSVKPNLLVYLHGFEKMIGLEFKLITAPDERYALCHVKSLNLLPNILAFQKAVDSGCQECVLHRDGVVTECSRSGLSIIVNGTVVTPPLSNRILPSTSRKHLLELCQQHGIPFEEREFTLDEMKSAEEIMVTSSLGLLNRAFEVDGQAAGGKNPALFNRLISLYVQRLEDETA